MTVADPSSRQRLDIILNTSTIAMVGVSANPNRASFFVATYFRNKNFKLYFVNPQYSEIMGQKCYSALAELPFAPDMVVAFRKASELPALTKEAIAVQAKTIWFQLGLRNAEAAQLAHEAGLQVVQDRCLKIEHARWAGGLHSAGFNSGVITSKRKKMLPDG